MALLIQHIIVCAVVLAAILWLIRHLHGMLTPSSGCGGCSGCAVRRMTDG